MGKALAAVFGHREVLLFFGNCIRVDLNLRRRRVILRFKQ